METLPMLLIADDDPWLRAVVKATLADDRFQQLEATNGTDAVALARQARPAVAILDLDMPGMNGIEVCRALRADPSTRGCFIVILTGSSGVGDRERAFAAGANTYLEKPFSPLQLMGLIDSALEMDAAPAQRTRQPEGLGLSLAAFMFADIRGFTEFTQRNGDEAAAGLVRAFQRLLRQQSDAYTGREINTAGDNMLIAFPTARQAVRAAVGCMQALKTYNEASPPHKIHAGVGIDVGEPVQDGANFIGNTLNKASRLTSRAAVDQILVTTVVRELVGATSDLRFERIELGELRGIEGSTVAYAVSWQE